MKLWKLASAILIAGLAFTSPGQAADDAGATAGGKANASGSGSRSGSGRVTVISRSDSGNITLSFSHGKSIGRATGVGRGGGNLAHTRAGGYAEVGAFIDPKTGTATIYARARSRASAVATGGGKKAYLASRSPLVTATAKGGLRPTASTRVVRNGKVITKASAVAGIAATASGGKTQVVHFGPHNRNTLAVTYTQTAYSAAVQTPKSATAYSGYARQGVTFTGPNLVAAIELAAYAFATADNNNASGRAWASGSAGARSDNALAYANVGVYASAFVHGDTVILKAGKIKGQFGQQQYCVQQGYYRSPEITLTCRAIPINAQQPVPVVRPHH